MAAAPPPKADELQPHPPKEQLANVSFCITSPPPWPEAVILGFQHFIVMLGTTVIIPSALVPQMGGGNEEKARVIQTLLFVAGINTLPGPALRGDRRGSRPGPRDPRGPQPRNQSQSPKSLIVRGTIRVAEVDPSSVSR